MTLSNLAVSASRPQTRYPRWLRDWWRTQPRHVWLTDLVVGLLVMLTVGLPVTFHSDWSYHFDWSQLAAWAPFTIALAVRRSAPWPALLLIALGFNLKLLFGAPVHGGDVAMLIVIFSCAANGSRLLMWVAGAGAIVFPLLQAVYMSLFPFDLPVIGQFAGEGFYGSSIFVFTTAIFALPLTAISVLCWLGGVLQRVQITAHQYAHSAELAELEFQRTQEQLVVEKQRNEIARDMHDVVAHSLAVVVAQADGGRYIMKSDPTKAEPVLETIAETAREALVDVRGLLAQLRHAQGIEPQKCLDDIPMVVERIRAAGLNIRTSVRGTRQSIGPAAELAVFRLVQEALTNSLKYGDNRVPTELDVRWDDVLRIRIRNQIADRPPIDAGTGNGVVGMHERLAVVGGDANVRQEGCFWVVDAFAPYHVECEAVLNEASAAAASEAEAAGATAQNEDARNPVAHPPIVETTHPQPASQNRA